MRNLRKDIKSIKLKRLPIEVKTVISLLDEIEEVDSIYFPNSVFYKYNNIVIFEKENQNKKMYINYDFFINLFTNTNSMSIEKKIENIEILINEKIKLENYDIKFVLKAHRIFWEIV